jgi:NAD(P)-dependent dehydrogenase (short-subunit alcohol dehydrogenase family)
MRQTVTLPVAMTLPTDDPTSAFRLDGRVALISGGTRGIGRAIAEVFARAGASVAVLARRRGELEETQSALTALGATALTHEGSQGDAESIEAVVQRCVTELGRLDVLVCNAAANPVYGPLVELDRGAVRKVLDVNLEGPLLLAQACWRHSMSDRGGSIINVAAGGGIRPVQGIGMYNVSKAALMHLTRQLALELGPAVRVNTLTPGLVKTDFARALWEHHEDAKAAALPARRLGIPEDLAHAALFLASDASSWVTGQNLIVDGGREIT